MSCACADVGQAHAPSNHTAPPSPSPPTARSADKHHSSALAAAAHCTAGCWVRPPLHMHTHNRCITQLSGPAKEVRALRVCVSPEASFVCKLRARALPKWFVCRYEMAREMTVKIHICVRGVRGICVDHRRGCALCSARHDGGVCA